MSTSFDTAVYGDGVITIPIPKSSGDCTMSDFDYWKERLYADRDRHSANATSFEKVLELQYAASTGFRDANAARIVMEAGSGRTRAESNGPDNTAAQRGT